MVVRSVLRAEQDAELASLLVDTSLDLPLALDEAGWKKAGFEVTELQTLPQDRKLKHGLVPIVRLGSFDVPNVPAVFGASPGDKIAEIERGLGVDLDGLLGSPVLAELRVTFTDGGRGMWFELLDASALEDPRPTTSAPQSPSGHQGTD